MGRDFQVYNEVGDYTVNVSICNPLESYCGVSDCSTCGSAPNHPETCFGAYDALTVVEALDYGMGILITYNDGANCSGCTGGSQRRTTLKLMCNQLLPEGMIQAENSSVIRPTDAELIIVGEWFCNYPSSAPVYYEPVLQIDYYNYHHLCNASLAYMIEQKYSMDCRAECIKTNESTTYRTCGEKLVIDKKKWVQRVLFSDEECESSPEAVTYIATDVCFGDVQYNAVDCDETEVQFLDCKFNPFCRNCKEYDTRETEECSYGEYYTCVDGRSNMITF
jgi:hypothetical protein